MRWLAIVLLVGCGGSTAVKGGGPVGSLALSQELETGGPWQVNAYFTRSPLPAIPPTSCIRTSGDCQEYDVDCPAWVQQDQQQMPAVVLDSAGVITITDGSASQMVMPDSDEAYEGGDSTAIWQAGDSLTISAAGDVVPAFSVTVTVPSPPTHIDAPPSTVPRNADLTLTWTGGSGGEVSFGLTRQGPNDGGNQQGISCSFPVTDGRGVVSKTLLQHFTAGGQGTISGGGIVAKSQATAGDYQLTVSTAAGLSGLDNLAVTFP